MQTSPARLIVFDLETTGLSPRWHEIIQIAAMRLDADGSIGGSFSTHVRPSRPVPKHITTLTGITNDDVAGAPAAPDALRAFASFAGGDAAASPVLVAHNGHRFDMRFLAAACERHGLATRPARFMDSLWLSKKLWPTESLHNLDAITARLGLSAASLALPRHDARADVHLLADAVRLILRRLPPRALSESLVPGALAAACNTDHETTGTRTTEQ